MEAILSAKIYLADRGISSADVGVVLGTGLHELINHIDVKETVSYADIPGFPVCTVEFHKGNLVFGSLGGKTVLVMQGRLHAYEGYHLEEIVFPVRVMREMGIKFLFLSNAAGGIHSNFKKGDLVLASDHINFLKGIPFFNRFDKRRATASSGLKTVYDFQLKKLLEEKALNHGIELKTGVYVAVPGPNLETSAEYRFLRIAGADMVGMSTVPEVITANQMKLPCAAVTVITDECDPDNLQPVNIGEIMEVARKADKKLSHLFADVIAAL